MLLGFSVELGDGTLPATAADGEGEAFGCFSTIASSGTAMTLFLVLVVIVAVELMPGRRPFLISSGKSRNSIVTLNSFASCTFTRLDRPPVVSDLETASGFFCVTTALISLSPRASTLTFTGWPTSTLEISVSSTFTSTLIVDMSAMVIKGVDDKAETAYSPTRVGMSAITPASGDNCVAFER